MLVVTNFSKRFCRSLRPFQAYTFTTRVLGWDEKWFYSELRFETVDKKAQPYVPPSRG